MYYMFNLHDTLVLLLRSLIMLPVLAFFEAPLVKIYKACLDLHLSYECKKNVVRIFLSSCLACTQF